MSSKTDQAVYTELYFDLEKAKTKLTELRSLLVETSACITDTYKIEQELLDAGEKVPARPQADVATRASITSALSMIFPQIQQLIYAVTYGQRSCSVLCPSLQISDVPN
jgi:hypothetical protein